MTHRHFLAWLLLALALSLSACGKADPQAQLEAAVQQLQDNLEAKDTSAVMAQLHPDFLARQELDREWAKRTMTLLFLRHKNIQVIALGKRGNRIFIGAADPTDQEAIERIKFATQLAPEWVLVEHDKLSKALEGITTSAEDQLSAIASSDFEFDVTEDTGTAQIHSEVSDPKAKLLRNCTPSSSIRGRKDSDARISCRQPKPDSATTARNGTRRPLQATS